MEEPLLKPTNGVSNGDEAKGSNGVHHDNGRQASDDHEERQYLDLIRRIIETGEVLTIRSQERVVTCNSF